MAQKMRIGENTYSFNFGFGFYKEISKEMVQPIAGTSKSEEIGLQWTVSKLIDGDVPTLMHVLLLGNNGQDPALSDRALTDYIESDECDIDKMFDDVMGFLKTANFCKKKVQAVLDQVEKARAKTE